MAEATPHRIYSCDDHLDIYHLPHDVWTERLPAKYRELGPHVIERKGERSWVAGKHYLGISGAYPGLATGRGHENDDGLRPGDPVLRMQDMDRDDIYGSVVYGPGALWGFPIDDPDLKLAVLRAWNDWAAEVFNAYMPERLYALAALPTLSPKMAIEELHRCVAMGHRGVLFRAHDIDLVELGEGWDDLWAAVEEADVPISFHIGGGTSLAVDGSRRLETPWKIPASVAILPLQLDEPFSVMMYCGALERHPGLKLVLAESGIGWLPYLVKRMDATFDKHCTTNPEPHIKLKPSEIFQRQVYGTFEEEPFGPQLIPLLGPDNFMWACDYPHPDSTWPESRKAIDEALGSLSEETLRKVTGETCQRLYKLV